MFLIQKIRIFSLASGCVESEGFEAGGVIAFRSRASEGSDEFGALCRQILTSYK